ncbi:MAG: ACP S-malonyltransferase [Oscillospiraceae bacterium]|nr:ACP S-malonyltransferase [Oscillospiraceae bacterium]
MGQIAFVFSGQGAQYPGMGKELFDAVPEAEKVFRTLDAIRPGTLEQCFSGSEETLRQTANTQPCMFAMEMAAAAALEARGVHCDAAAGFSLGEIAALTYTGAVSLEEGFRLVCARGRLMQEDAEAKESGMAAVLKLTPEQVEALCSQYPNVYPVNYNCPGQISVAGGREVLKDFQKAVKEAGGRAIPLKVQGGFHSPFMADAAQKFAALLEPVVFQTPQVPLYSNYTALPYTNDFRQLLSQQIVNPVRWQAIIEHMAEQGIDTFVELGPGKTLCGLIAKTCPQARVFHVEDLESLEETRKGVQ